MHDEISELRSLFYKCLAKLVDYPYDEDVENMGDYLAYLIELSAQLEKGSEVFRDISTLARNCEVILEEIDRLGTDYFQSEYVSTFELGYPRPVCPLYAREYSGETAGEKEIEILKEVSEFYFRYGADIGNETPDFLPIELEFSAFLINNGEEVEKDEEHKQVQLDYLEKHLSWLNALHQHAKEICKLDGYVRLIELTDNFVSKDHTFLESSINTSR